MSKLANLNVLNAVACFKSINDDVRNEVVSDIVSLLGNEEKNMVSTAGGWKISDKGILTSKEGHKLQLPVNNAAVVMLKFGMQITAIANAAEIDIDADVPKQCTDYIKQKSLRLAAKAKAPVTA